MDEIVRRRLLWIALAASAGFLVLTLVLAALNALSAGWYLIGAAVYGAVAVLALVGFLTERAQPAPAAPAPAQAQAPAPQVPEVRTEVVRERVIYSTHRGQVLEVRIAANGASGRDYEVETEGRQRSLAAIEAEVDARGWTAGKAPSEGELRKALQRWGRLREVS